ncbi:putative polysaccharide deacetylase [Lyophyllum shimeji]|uniref:Polysaccharide deacetylase n=1 Tax=Lyophyllum shimeji TaxID=47721 RepID=A0A9P3PFL3_LYOSH|nr:putative polysaccharide deacetylase [Lyophyllum shimeji]
MRKRIHTPARLRRKSVGTPFAPKPNRKKRKAQVSGVTALNDVGPAEQLKVMLIEWLGSTPNATTRECIHHFTPYVTDADKKTGFSGLVREVAQLKGGVLVLREKYQEGGSSAPSPAHCRLSDAQRLPDTWYQPDDHPVHALFKRGAPGDGTNYPAVGSPTWSSAYPVTSPDVNQLPKEWVDALNAAVSAGKIPNIPQSSNTPGVSPVYPAGYDPNGQQVCSATYKCRIPGDIWDGPPGTFSISFDDGPLGGVRVAGSRLVLTLVSKSIRVFVFAENRGRTGCNSDHPGSGRWFYARRFCGFTSHHTAAPPCSSP